MADLKIKGTGLCCATIPKMKILIHFLMVFAALVCAAQKRLVLIDQDGSGPGGSNQMAMLSLLQAPQVEVLGITMVTGNAWRDEETLHTLRMLELTGHGNVPVAKGAVFPLVRTERETQLSSATRRQGDVAGRVGTGADDAGREQRRRHSGHARQARHAWALRDSAAARGHAVAQADRRRRGAFPHSPGARASAPGDDLCGWAADQHCAGHFDRSGICGAHAGHRDDGRQPESADRRSGVRHQPAA